MLTTIIIVVALIWIASKVPGIVKVIASVFVGIPTGIVGWSMWAIAGFAWSLSTIGVFCIIGTAFWMIALK